MDWISVNRKNKNKNIISKEKYKKKKIKDVIIKNKKV